MQSSKASRKFLQELALLLASVLLFVGAIVALLVLSFGLYVALALTLVGIFSMLIYSYVTSPSGRAHASTTR